MSTLVFLTICRDFSEAQVLKSYLQSQGFHPKVRDEQMRTVAPHLENLMGKLVIEVPEEEFLEASAALEALEQSRGSSNHLKLADEDSRQEQLLHTQSLAKKALLNSLIGCLFLPVLCNLYSLVLGWRVLRNEKPLSATSGQRLLLAILFNSLAFYIWLTFGFKYFLRSL